MLSRLEITSYVLATLFILLFALGKAKAFWVAENTFTVNEHALQPAILSNDLSNDYWSQTRKQKYARLSAVTDKKPVGVLNIHDIAVKVPIFEGVSDEELDIGVGRVPGSGTLQGQGNLVIAGHRDSFFRQLGQLSTGQVIEVSTFKGRLTQYQVTEHIITTPDDVSIMEDGNTDELTLVTCYPFYFVGPAPQRYIIKAKRI